jgi:hypothetical protein
MLQHIIKYSTWILSGILVLAGVLKIIDPIKTSDILVFFGVASIDTANIIVYVIAVAEIIIGTLFLKYKEKKVVQFLMIGTVGSFLLISIVGYIFSWELACGCFGRFSFGRFDLNMLIRNSTLFMMTVLVIVGPYLQRDAFVAINKNK